MLPELLFFLSAEGLEELRERLAHRGFVLCTTEAQRVTGSGACIR